jgi:glucose/arabinose dehydrogenase
MALQAHSAPLGITFYHWKDPENMPGECPPGVAFPREMDGFAFMAYHGSWNRRVPTGYKVVYVAMDEDGNPIGESPTDLLAHVPPDAKWESGFRPVDVDFDACGRLLVTSDGTRDEPKFKGSMVVRIEKGVANIVVDSEDNNEPSSGVPFRRRSVFSTALTGLLFICTAIQQVTSN